MKYYIFKTKKIPNYYYLFPLLLVVILIFYSQIINSNYIFWKDFDLIKNNHFSIEQNNSNIEPLFDLIFSTTKYFNIESPVFFHYINIFFQYLIIIFAYYLIKAFSPIKFKYIIIGYLLSIIIYFSNPITIYNTYWIYAMKELLMITFILISLNYFIRSKSFYQNSYLLSIFFMILACLCNRNSYYLFILFISSYITNSIIRKNSLKIKHLLPYILIDIAFFVYYHISNYYSYYNTLITIQNILNSFIINICPLTGDFYISKLIFNLEPKSFLCIFPSILIIFMIIVIIININNKHEKQILSTWLVCYLLCTICSHLFHEDILSQNTLINYQLSQLCFSTVGILIIYNYNKLKKSTIKSITITTVILTFTTSVYVSYCHLSGLNNETSFWSNLCDKYPDDTFLPTQKNKAKLLHKEQILKKYSKPANIAFEKETIDIGNISRDSLRTRIYFKFKNRGNIPAIISNVRTSCGCTQAFWPHTPILPQAEGEIQIDLALSSLTGIFSKTTTINFNNSANIYKLTIKGQAKN